MFIALIILAVIIRWIASAHAYATYGSGGYDHGMWYWLLYAMFANSGGGSYSGRGGYSSGSSGGGFFGGGGGGGFSGGGGSFGGGGAGGSW